MRKKLQIFVSSTYTDLLNERQAAVEAILSAGHIPAGMELFAAGNESQLETIRRWIDESDVYLLILGGRYGSIEPKSKKSYTQLEYEYALDRNIPLFAVVMNDRALEEKVKTFGKDALEADNQSKYKSFKKVVLSKTSKFFEDVKDIKIAIHETLADFEKRYEFAGWVSGKDTQNNDSFILENSRLLKENYELKNELELIKQKSSIKDIKILGFEFGDIVSVLKETEVLVPANLSSNKKDTTNRVLELFLFNKERYAIGITNDYSMSEIDKFLFFTLAPKLLIFNLLEKTSISNSSVQRIQISQAGYKFLSTYALKTRINKNQKIANK